MKKIFFLFLPFIISSCNDYKTKIVAQESSIDSLKKINVSLKTEIEIKDEKIRTLTEKTSTANEKSAIEAIKYELKMYNPDVRYTSIRTVKKSDGTIDVILDIPMVVGGEVVQHEHKYYNVSTFSDGSYKINKDWGLVF